ncbi:MAG: transglycosylase SLT domain-containing protein [Gemmatimonadota bacterium]
MIDRSIRASGVSTPRPACSPGRRSGTRRSAPRWTAVPLLAVLAVLCARTPLAAQAAAPAFVDGSTVPASPNPAFPVPVGLVPQVEFWKTVYSSLSKDEVLYHDRVRMDVVYGRHRVPEALTPSAEVANDNYLRAAREGYRRVLSALARGFDRDTLSGEALRIYELWGRGSTPGTFAAAVDNVRWQRGLRERFIEGLASSGRYQSHVERVFREEGVPLELTFLPFVESMYDTRAYSSVGAAGVWQFMPATGRLFMRVDGTIDERLDPIRAARAAARLLRQNHQRLGTWPLAITAYNHGPYGVQNAVRTMGTRDIERIVKGYTGRGFGFASRNFYTEFLAALDVRRNYRRHFGEVRLDDPLEFDEATLPVAARFSRIAEVLEVPVEALWEVNPAFTANARRRDQPVPAGYRLRLPENADADDDWDDVLEALRGQPPVAVVSPGASRSSVAPGLRGPAAAAGADWYVVRSGDTLGGIAQRHGLTLTSLRRLNGLGASAIIHPGQRLRIRR